MEIANIVSKDKMDLGPEFKIYETLEEILHPNLPTLIVGCHYAKELVEAELDFLNRKIKDNLFWTFTKKELRKKYFNDLEDFIQYSVEYSVSKLNYIYFDLIQYESSKLKKIIRKLYELTDIISYYHGNMIYIYSGNLIFGIDLELFKYIYIDTKRILNKIKEKSLVFLEGSEILIEYKNYMERLDNRVRFIPFIYSITNHE